MAKNIKTVAIEQVRLNPHALRSVDEQSEEFQGILANIEADMRNPNLEGHGVIIDVRDAVDPVTQEKFYEVVDGGHRFSALKMLGAKEVHVLIMPLSDTEALTRQITKNIHNKATKPVELAAGIRTILNSDKNCKTVEDVATLLKKSPAYIKQLLRLNNITNADIAKQIDDGKISLNNAFALLKLPEKEQLEFLDSAMTDKSEDFKTKVNEHLKVLRADRAKGEPGSQEPVFTAVQYLRNKGEIQTALNNPDALANELPATNVSEAIRMTLEWVLCIDKASLAAQKQAFDTRMETKRKAREAKAAEKAKKKAEEAKKAAEEAVAIAEASKAAEAVEATA